MTLTRRIRLSLVMTVGLLLQVWPTPGHAQADVNGKIMWAANWSADGTTIATGGDNGILRFHDGQSYKLIMADSSNKIITRLRWHPTDHVLAVTGGKSYMLYPKTDKRTDLSIPGDTGARAIDWSADGSKVAVADFEGDLFVWTRDGKHLKTIHKEVTKSYVGVAWHPEGNEIIAISEYVRRYSLDGEPMARFKYRPDNVLMLCVLWHPSGQFYAIGDYGVPDETTPVLEWFDNDNNSIFKSEVSKAEYRNMSWNHDGTLLATASDALRIWTLEGELLYTGASRDNLWGVDWSPDGSRIVTTSGASEIVIWSSTAERLHEIQY